MRLNQLADGQQFLLNFVELVVGQPHGWEYRLAVDVAILPDHNITAAEVFEVVGKGAQGADDRVRIPPGFVLDAFALNGALPQQIIEINREFTHSRATSAFA